MKLKKSISEKEKINPKELQKQYANKLEENLSRQGVVFFDEHNLNVDTDFMVLPHEITEVSGRDLGEYLNAFTQQKLYLRTLMCRTEVESDIVSREYFDKAHPLYRRYSTDKLSEKAKDRMINGDPQIAEYYNRFVEVRRKLSMLSKSIENIEDAIFLISREISRRTTDFDMENRNMSVQGK